MELGEFNGSSPRQYKLRALPGVEKVAVALEQIGERADFFHGHPTNSLDFLLVRL